MKNNSNKLSFPIFYSTLEMISDTQVLNCHWHNNFEFLLIESGSAMFKIENSYFEAHTGEIVIINSNEIHSARSIDNSPCVCKSLKFDLSILSSKEDDLIQVKFIKPLLDKALVLPNLIFGNGINQIFVKEMIVNLFHILESKNQNYELLAKSYLYLILSKLIPLSKSVSIKANSNNTNIFKEILNYIHINYNKHLTIKELASIFNMSEGYFCRFFKSFTFKTPIDYINYYRISKAKELLLTTSKSISDIALEVGFNNISYFINIFKKNTYYTPARFRKKYSNLTN